MECLPLVHNTTTPEESKHCNFHYCARVELVVCCWDICLCHCDKSVEVYRICPLFLVPCGICVEVMLCSTPLNVIYWIPVMCVRLLLIFFIVYLSYRCPLGENWTKAVAEAQMKCKWIKLSSLLKQHTATDVWICNTHLCSDFLVCVC